MPPVVPGAGPRGGVHRLLCPRLQLSSRSLPAQCELPAPQPVPLPAEWAALCAGSSGSPGLQQLHLHLC